MAVLVLDRHKNPLMPCSEKRARKLLERGRARIHRLMPFSIRLVDRTVNESMLQPVKIKLDPGSKTTGIAVVRHSETMDDATGEIHVTVHVLNLFELHHRGQQISESLTARRQMRRRRRGNLRYRKPRFLNCGNKGKGWLAPSLQHRVDTTGAWVHRLQRLAPVTGIAQELVRFDLQQMENPEISGVEYQQGTLAGYETREYLLNKWNRECAYCGTRNVPLQIEHITPKAKGGSPRISNLTLACRSCNQQKGAQEINVFLAKDPQRLARIQAQAKRPLKDAAAVNTTRWVLFNTLKITGLPVTTGSGGLTKFNRTRLDIPKTHALDAACVGDMDEIRDWNKPTLAIKATGRGSYQRTRLNAYGFPRGYLTRQKRIKGFQTGDRVKAEVTQGKKIGSYLGRVAVRASGSFNLQTAQGVIRGMGYRYCKVIQRADGYGYSQPLNPKEAELRSARYPSPA
ncbi:RNA-guided endonuclease IscB [Candidatus Contendibacter odensensis]|uniref:HNH endonuclease n=1 Tax=Candidatus Contendobacter odensis Run_B_J11 TaxID=1400861 RepID=A0A7U7J5J8_9GAMM|nr:RNA-guided endonuclease IscB [Candidatus Contendobacter odensis]CDH46882.1 putative HNH endonuclease [Candidatus Contendobacter odensis Run_B_J11]